ncbi:MAG: hypothetical protein GY866_04795, partial [Proteobacteria bacterium]|nr:hypothetical protein [Pseudomonadota bacterium]
MTLFQPEGICLLLVCISLPALSLGFGLDASIKLLAGQYDSLRYLSMADTISMGQWQGEYDQTTLIRLPMYPLFIAINALAGWPLHIIQHFIYLLSVFLLSASLITIN